MSEEKKLKLCQQVFESKPYLLRISKSKTDAKFRCIRRKVILLYTFVKIFSAKIASIRCPILKNLTTNSFFLASTLLVPGMIAFLKITPFVEILPDAFIFGLNSEGLLQQPASMTKSVERSLQKPTSIAESVSRRKEHPLIKRKDSGSKSQIRFL